MTKFIETDSNGNEWFEIDGATYGITPEGRGMDEDGAPLDGTFSELNSTIQDKLEQAVASKKQ